jgi:photosystem II stability/assembly factor-like uncharacterized protein
MKSRRIITCVLMIIFLKSYSQFNELAPWMQNVKNKRADSKEYTIDELKAMFDEYWKTHDKNKKGSGYKPFMRWFDHWENMSNEQGFIANPQDMKNAWNQKQQAKADKNSKLFRAMPASNWKPIGPFTFIGTGSWADGQGRVNIIHVDPSNSNTIYVGTPAGGIWKSTDAGANWTPLSDDLPQIGVSGIAVDYTDSNTIYIATGDKDGGNTYSIGVLKSTDGGMKWNTTGLSFTNTTSKAGDIVMDPKNNKVLWCATNVGLYKTIDAGATWKIVQSGNFSSGNIRLKPDDSKIVYAVSDDKFFRSTDGGDKFTSITNGFPNSSSRLVMDVTPANSNYIYVLSALSSNFYGVYKSTDGGISFKKTKHTDDLFEHYQAYYNLALSVSSTNAEEVYTGCFNVWKSTNGGDLFTKLSQWDEPTSDSYTHADIHFLGFFGNKFYCGSDGGIYVSTNGGAKFTSITKGLQIGQFYRIATSKESSSKLVGGLQDNGGYAFSNNIWKNFYGADGMDTAIDPKNSNKYYGFMQNGRVLHISNNAGDALTSEVKTPEPDSELWITPLTINSQGELFAAYTKLHKLNSAGNKFEAQSLSKIGTGPVDLITIDPSNDQNMIVANDKDLYVSSNKGVDFTKVFTAQEDITSVCINSSNKDIVYITTKGTTGKVLKSIDGGKIFNSISEGLPDIGKNVIKHQGKNTLNPLYLGTSLGVYYRDDSMNAWMPFDTNLPNVPVRDLEVNLEDNIITAATYGRGVWQANIPGSLSNAEFELTGVSIAPNPSDGIFKIKSGNNPIDSIVVYDVSGKILESIKSFGNASSETTINLQSLSNGIYFVKVSSDNKSIVKQIIKN